MFESRFQGFDDPGEGSALGPRLQALREELARRKLTGLLIPRADQHQNEYVPPSEERLAWLSGFTGSAGLALVLADRAVLFVDGRYTLQAAQQIDGTQWTVASLVDPPPEGWIAANVASGSRIGFDPWLHTTAAAEKLAAACARAGAELVAVETNPIDAVWTSRPEPPLGQVSIHDERFAGESAAQKIARIRRAVNDSKLDALILSDAHAVAWAFNIRGADVAHTPLPLSYALVPKDGRPSIFIDGRKLSNAARAYLSDLAEVVAPAEMTGRIARLAASGAAIGLDAATAADALSRAIAMEGGKPVRAADPVALMKAVKNPAEIEGARVAHRRDGVALIRFLSWLDREASTGGLTEIDVVEALETFRRDSGVLRDVSFPTICGAGPNGAIVHYRVTRATNRRVHSGELLLVDSGAQYEDGTTDVTRTIAIGEPTGEMRDRFTRVLKGHIAISAAIFVDGTSGAQIDALARQFLWHAGLDYDHGTGHGVGSYLSVHEGPARISKIGTIPMKRGMILSNEPGYYKTRAYGIRIENLVIVQEAIIDGAERPMNGFEVLTLAPIDRRLIDIKLLTPAEIAWVDAYHARVAQTLSPSLDAETQTWLAAATAPLA